jgi:hypothetical protein
MTARAEYLWVDSTYVNNPDIRLYILNIATFPGYRLTIPFRYGGAIWRRPNGGDGWRWPRTGATRTPNAAAQAVLVLTHLPCVTGMWLRAAQWSHYREAARKNPTAVEHKGKSTGGRTEQASNIARGTPGSSVTCGFALSDSISCEMPSCSEAARLRGPWVAERPGVPRAPVFRGCADGDEGIRRARAANNRAGGALAV